MAQYRYYFPKAQDALKAGLALRDAWAKTVAEDMVDAPELKDVVLLALGFLLTETARERNFPMKTAVS